MPSMTLTRETFGEKLHRAYRRSKNEYGITYDQIAERISAIGFPCSGQTVFRCEAHDEVPRTSRGLLMVWLFAAACGYDPAELGIKTPAGKLLDWSKVQEELDPARWTRQVAPSRIRSRCSSGSGAGTSSNGVLAS